MTGFAVFDSPLGGVGIAWDGDVVVGLQLPGATAHDTRERLATRFPDAEELVPPRAVQEVIDSVDASLRGVDTDLAAVPLALDRLPRFSRDVYEVVRAIPAGETLSYGEVAEAAGSPGAARAVGQALGRNPFPIVVPCHRVLAAGGRVGGFSATGGTALKLRMLAAEGVMLST
jgi:methylated-DNA-[protein]-cysteine S-methyltransferase